MITLTEFLVKKHIKNEDWLDWIEKHIDSNGRIKSKDTPDGSSGRVWRNGDRMTPWAMTWQYIYEHPGETKDEICDALRSMNLHIMLNREQQVQGILHNLLEFSIYMEDNKYYAINPKDW